MIATEKRRNVLISIRNTASQVRPSTLPTLLISWHRMMQG